MNEQSPNERNLEPIRESWPSLQGQADSLLRELGIEPEPTDSDSSGAASAESEISFQDPIEVADEALEDAPDDSPDDLLDDLDLDPILAESPDLKRRWEIETAKLREKASSLKQEALRHETLISWGRALDDPSTAWDAYRQLGEKLAEFHQLPQPNPQSGSKDTAGGGEVSDPWQQELKREIAQLREMIEPIRTEREQTARERAFEQKIDAVAPKVIERLSRADAGWQVTREMVAEAVRNLPNLAQRPSEAVRKWFSDDRARHYSRLASVRHSVPDMTGRGFKPAGSIKDPAQMTGEEVIRALGF